MQYCWKCGKILIGAKFYAFDGDPGMKIDFSISYEQYCYDSIKINNGAPWWYAL